MRPLKRFIVGFALTLLTSTNVSAEVYFDLVFTGTIDSVTESDFNLLIQPGDPISGTVHFKWLNPTYVPNAPATEYTIPAGPVVIGPSTPGAVFETGFGGPPDYTSAGFRWGDGPSVSLGDEILSVDGLFVKVHISGPSTADDYLALDAADLEMLLLGSRTPKVGPLSGGIQVATVALTSAAFVPADQHVPELADTRVLLLVALATLGGLSCFFRRTVTT